MTKINVILKPQGRKPELVPDLYEKEFFAIGRITTSFAYLERLILFSTLEICEANNIALPKQAFAISFDRRRNAWREVINKMTQEKQRQRLMKVHDQVANVKGLRNLIAHGSWDWNYSSPSKVSVSELAPLGSKEEHYDFDGLMKLATKIGEINFDLTYPNGQKQFIKERAKNGFGISRDYVRLLRGEIDSLSGTRPSNQEFVDKMATLHEEQKNMRKK